MATKSEVNAIADKKEELKADEFVKVGNIIQKPALYQSQRSLKFRQSMATYKPIKAQIEVPHPNNQSLFFDRMLHNPEIM